MIFKVDFFVNITDLEMFLFTDLMRRWTSRMHLKLIKLLA